MPEVPQPCKPRQVVVLTPEMLAEEVADERLLAATVRVLHACEERLVALRRAFELALVLGPGRDEVRLDLAQRLLDVLAERPLHGAVAAPHPSQLAHRGHELGDVFRFDLVLDGDTTGPSSGSSATSPTCGSVWWAGLTSMPSVALSGNSAASAATSRSAPPAIVSAVSVPERSASAPHAAAPVAMHMAKTSW